MKKNKKDEAKALVHVALHKQLCSPVCVCICLCLFARVFLTRREGESYHTHRPQEKHPTENLHTKGDETNTHPFIMVICMRTKANQPCVFFPSACSTTTAAAAAPFAVVVVVAVSTADGHIFG